MSKAPAVAKQEQRIFSIISPILEKQIERQDEQGKIIHNMYDGIKSMYSEITEGLAEMKSMVEEVRNSVTLTNAECFGLQSAVASKSISLTKDRFEEEGDDFSRIVGKYRRMVWKQMKLHFNVPKYNCLRRIEYDEALQFVARFKPEDYI